MTESASAMTEKAESDCSTCPTARPIMQPAMVRFTMRMADSTPPTEEPIMLQESAINIKMGQHHAAHDPFSLKRWQWPPEDTHISRVLALISSHTSLMEMASTELVTLSAAEGGGGGSFRSSGFSGGSLP
ncbi:unnamed protein product [Phytophthora fragariaefolia]|uniref:Unnamed protein product n=1 Tax=Phytophthora fragariaefolia TaxID=1490495 RepID=A0A9W6XJV3_9STRA|nr:unnamed protein product [Phytophthora fragariaefolia]